MPLRNYGLLTGRVLDITPQHAFNPHYLLSVEAVSLAGFIEAFVDTQLSHPKEAGGITRTTMIQPGVYFTLDAPFVSSFFFSAHFGVLSASALSFFCFALFSFALPQFRFSSPPWYLRYC